MQTIGATVPMEAPPDWALLERHLIETMEAAVEPFLAKYTHADGRLIWREGLHASRDGADDFYESFYNWPLLYLLGGSDRLLELGKRQWDATTRLLEEIGHVDKEYEIGYDQFHQSESYIYFYLLCMADPADPVLADRARRFAGFYLGEDPEADNYDAELRLIRAPHNGSRGPRWGFGDAAEPAYGYSPGMAVYGLPYEDVEGVKSVEDLKDPVKARRMGQAMQERMSRGDVAANLGVAPLVANAFLLTGEQKYADWLVEYVGAWAVRARDNDGLLPDNVGLSGQVGEYVDGKWYGGLYGWTWPHGFYNIGMGALVAGFSAFLASGDPGFLDLPRTQIDRVMAQGRLGDVDQEPMSLRQHWIGQLEALGEQRQTFLVPYRYADSGWFDFQPMSPIFPAALWALSGEPRDYAVIEAIRRQETYDWRQVHSFRSKEDAGHEQPWLRFLAGDNPQYPERILQAALTQVYRRLQQIRSDETDPRDNHIHWWQQLNPVTTEALVQLTLGAPQMIYNGGLLLAPLRYFDGDRRRPGLPPGVAALVEEVEQDHLAVRLVNLEGLEARRVVVQAGSLGTHRFGRVLYDEARMDAEDKVGEYSGPPYQTVQRQVSVNAAHFEVELPPGTQIRLQVELQRFVTQARYAGPWDPIPKEET